MPLISSYLLITAHALTALAASYVLLTHPAVLASSSPVWIIGESMHIRPPPASFSLPSEPIAAAALILALAALSQLFFVGGLAAVNPSGSRSSSKQKTTAAAGGGAGAGSFAEQLAVLRSSQSSWMALAATRVFVMGGLAAWTYLVKSSDRDGSTTLIDTDAVGAVRGTGLLANSVVFTAAMGEMLFWGYVWTVLKKEAGNMAKTVMAGREGKQAVLNQNGTVTWEEVS